MASDPDVSPRDLPEPAPNESPTSGRCFRSFPDALRQRHGERVFRVDLESSPAGTVPDRTPHPGLPRSQLRSVFAADQLVAPATTPRDALIRVLSDLNHRYGARRFLAALTVRAPDTWADEATLWCRAAFSLTPVVGLILVCPRSAEIAPGLEILRRFTAPDRECWIELDVPRVPGPGESSRIEASSCWPDFDRNVKQAREASIPVIADLTLGVPGSHEPEWLHAIRNLNRLRVRLLRVHPYHIERTGTSLGPGVAGESLLFPDEHDYIAALARLVERLDPATLLHGLGPRVAPQRIASPRWLSAPTDYYQKLDNELARRGSRQGRLYQNDRTSSTP